MAGNTMSKWFPTTWSPVIASAPMYGVATGILAGEVSRAGGLGFIPGGIDFSSSSSKDLIDLDKQLAIARGVLAITDSSAVLPVGVGFLTFHPSASKFAETVIPVLKKHKPAALWLFCPQTGSTTHRDMIRSVKDAGQSDWNPKVFVQVGTVTAAREALDDGADGIVAQGVDAGGHQWAQGAGVISLVPEIRAMLREEQYASREIALLAAGGIAHGSSVAAALAMGADGAVMGTKFLATNEAAFSDAKKQVILQTSDGGLNTVKSMLHDYIQNNYFWPEPFDGRAVVGANVLDERAGLSLAENQEKLKTARAAGDVSRDVVWAGTGVGMVKEILPAAQVVEQTRKEAIESIRALSAAF